MFGDHQVTLYGSEFVLGATCKFGTAVGLSASVASSTLMTCLSPGQPAGTYTVEMTNNNYDYTRLRENFVYYGALAASSSLFFWSLHRHSLYGGYCHVLKELLLFSDALFGVRSAKCVVDLANKRPALGLHTCHCRRSAVCRKLHSDMQVRHTQLCSGNIRDTYTCTVSVQP